MVFDLTQSNPVLDDTKVDNIINRSGVVDTLSPLDIDIPDGEIIRNLDNRIKDSQGYWNAAKGFDLSQRRNRNVKYHLGHQINTNNLYRFQTPYIENELFIGVESMVAYLTAQQAQPEVYPAQDTDRSKIFAKDLEKALISHSEKFNVMSLAITCSFIISSCVSLPILSMIQMNASNCLRPRACDPLPAPADAEPWPPVNPVKFGHRIP